MAQLKLPALYSEPISWDPVDIPVRSIFSSPEPKWASNVLLSVFVRRPSFVNFVHFHLLEDTWLDFNQTWQESSLGIGDSKLFK